MPSSDGVLFTKKNPGLINHQSGMSLFYPQNLRWVCLLPRSHHSGHQAGLLTFGSPYSSRLPIPKKNSGLLRISSPITAAGLSPILTEFPFRLLWAPDNVKRLLILFFSHVKEFHILCINCFRTLLLRTQLTCDAMRERVIATKQSDSKHPLPSPSLITTTPILKIPPRDNSF